MTHQEILEGNKLIAEFMGWKNISGKSLTFDDTKCWFNDKMELQHNGDLRYHSSWDWLMPVVEKIEHCDDDKNDRGYSYHVCIFDKDCHIFEFMNDDEQPPIFTSEGITKINAAWLAIVEFIKWYNTNVKEEAK